MENFDTSEMLECAKKLRDFCHVTLCGRCVFFDKKGCALEEDLPVAWILKNPEDLIKEPIKEMIYLQYKYDKAVFEKNNCDYGLINTKILRAYLDELGEVNHATKGDWCWWKQTQKPVNREEVLEELADALHFALMKHISENLHTGKNIFEGIDEIEEGIKGSVGVSPLIFLKCYQNCVNRAANNDFLQQDLIASTVRLAKSLDYTFEELYEAYKRKNKINYERLENGY